MSTHRCHAKNCKKSVPPAMFMCKRHWFMLPKLMRDSVWSEYIPGQEISKDPTMSYLEVTREAIDWLAEKEGIT